MARFLLDTSFIVDVLNNRRDRPAVMKSLIAEQHELACCPVNVTEVYGGMRAPESGKTKALLRSLEYVPIRWEASRLAGRMKQEWAVRAGRCRSRT
jgi:predicted nucleic acid-binding protein